MHTCTNKVLSTKHKVFPSEKKKKKRKKQQQHNRIRFMNLKSLKIIIHTQ